MVYKNLQCTFTFSLFQLLLWLTMCHCNGLDNHIRRSSFIRLQMDVTHEASEKTSPGHCQFFPILSAQASSPCQGQGWLISLEGGDCLSDHHDSLQMFYVIVQDDAMTHKRQPGLLLTESSVIIHDSTWAEDLNFIMCFINLGALEITYSITGSKWIPI